MHAHAGFGCFPNPTQLTPQVAGKGSRVHKRVGAFNVDAVEHTIGPFAVACCDDNDASLVAVATREGQAVGFRVYSFGVPELRRTHCSATISWHCRTHHTAA